MKFRSGSGSKEEGDAFGLYNGVKECAEGREFVRFGRSRGIELESLYGNGLE